MLGSRMQRHGEEMMLLLVSVMMLQHGDTEILAEQVATEPRLSRPAAGEAGTISAMLPTRFFDLQEELQVRSRAMAEAARTTDAVRIVRAYGKLAETCVTCHSVYLNAESRADLPGD
jgi:cytochrome c556